MWDCRGRDRMVDGFTTTYMYAISAYHHWCYEFEFRSGQCVQHYVIKVVSDLRQVSGFLRVLQFPPKIKLTQGSRWASPMSPFANFNFIWRQNTTLGDFFGDNILLIKNYFVQLSINGAGKKHRLLERASRWQIIKTGNKSITSDC